MQTPAVDIRPILDGSGTGDIDVGPKVATFGTATWSIREASVTNQFDAPVSMSKVTVFNPGDISPKKLKFTSSPPSNENILRLTTLGRYPGDVLS